MKKIITEKRLSRMARGIKRPKRTIVEPWMEDGEKEHDGTLD